MNADTLLTRVKRGEQLTKRELDFVRAALAEGTTRDDSYTLIHILWRACDIRSTGLLWARAGDADEMVRRIALQALAELSPSEEVFNLARRMAQDQSGYVRMAATAAIGTLGALLPQRAPEAARFLLENLEQSQSKGDQEWEWYYWGLLELVQVPYTQRPLPTRDLLITDVQPEVIATARAMAANP